MSKKETKTSNDKNIRNKSEAKRENGKDVKVNGTDNSDKEKEEDNSAEEIKDPKDQPEESSCEDNTESDEQKTSEDKTNEWKDKYMRLSAEFDNYRKRTLKEKADLLRMSNEDLLKNILPIVDDFERGIENINKSSELSAIKEGVELIHGKFKSFLEKNGVKEINADKKEFDLDYHEAVTKIPAPEKDLKGKVLDTVEKGYILNDKVIRYAKVVIGE